MSVLESVRAPENRLARMFFAAAAVTLLLSTIATVAGPLGAQTSCSLSISFDETRLLNNGVENTAGPFAAQLEAGVYTVIIVSEDNHSTQVGVGTQPNEQFSIVSDSGYRSPLTNDVPDDGDATTTTFNSQTISASSSITLEHAQLGGVNSVNPVSACFVLEAAADTDPVPADPVSCDTADDAAADTDAAASEDCATEDEAVADTTCDTADDAAADHSDAASCDTAEADDAAATCDTAAADDATDTDAAASEDCTDEDEAVEDGSTSDDADDADIVEVDAATDTDASADEDDAAANNDDEAVTTEVEGVVVENSNDSSNDSGDDSAADEEAADDTAEVIDVEVQGAVLVPSAQVDSGSGTAQVDSTTGAPILAVTGAGDVWKILMQMSIVLMAMGALCIRWGRVTY